MDSSLFHSLMRRFLPESPEDGDGQAEQPQPQIDTATVEAEAGGEAGVAEAVQSLGDAPTILDDYVTSLPCDQNALDLFQGQWTSEFPSEASHLQAGAIGLFEDVRMSWAENELGGFKGMKALELGPLEGGHTYMLEKGGAASIVAVEANSRGFLKCLVTKEVLKLKRSSFLLGDFLHYLRNNTERFDLCVANGVLYHMREPAELIQLIGRTSDKAIIWTHYYDGEIIQADPEKARYFAETQEHDFLGFTYETTRYNYLEALGSGGFCGGTAPFSRWMNRQDILDCLRYFGFNDVRIGFDNPVSERGPSFQLVCSK